jgi:hypothetical protein
MEPPRRGQPPEPISELPPQKCEPAVSNEEPPEIPPPAFEMLSHEAPRRTWRWVLWMILGMALGAAAFHLWEQWMVFTQQPDSGAAARAAAASSTRFDEKSSMELLLRQAIEQRNELAREVERLAAALTGEMQRNQRLEQALRDAKRRPKQERQRRAPGP